MMDSERKNMIVTLLYIGVTANFYLYFLLFLYLHKMWITEL